MHRSISYKTLYNPKDEGVFRKNDDIYVVDGITGSVAHTPPSFMEVEKWSANYVNLPMLITKTFLFTLS
jgi:hypothetical protein